MYVRTPRAYAWRDEALACERTSDLSPNDCRPQIRWAKTPWPKATGALVAVRLVLQQVQVGVRGPGGQLRWVGAGQVLAPRQARRWASNGF